ncbi:MULTISPECIES: cupin domain-containing protein [unclassified Mesorhizobium]|nr:MULTISPECIES: cupin domain-containing protein [unclassified Mesorhizobium]
MVFLVTGENSRHARLDGPSGVRHRAACSSGAGRDFYVLDGECEWHVGERMVRATPGTYLFIPPEVPHNITTSARNRPAC